MHSETTYRIEITTGRHPKGQRQFAEIKDAIKGCGGKWDPATKTWTLTLAATAKDSTRKFSADGDKLDMLKHLDEEGWSTMGLGSSYNDDGYSVVVDS